MTYPIGTPVEVRSGRDSGRLMRIVGREGDYLLLADGTRRPVDTPKRKNPKHVRAVPSRADSIVAQKLLRGEPIRNKELRKDLAVISQEKADKDQGGIKLGKR